MHQLRESYELRKHEIKERLDYFRRQKTGREIFAELCFCLLTPQSRAKSCWSAVERLMEGDSSDARKIRKHLKGVRFANKKAGYIAEAKKSWDEIRNKAMTGNAYELREWLVKNVRGIGSKEDSHFLRNIGVLDFAILDRHILKNLRVYGVIGEIPGSMTPRKYREIEEKMRKFSEEIGIPMPELDLLFWSEETGEVFK